LLPFVERGDFLLNLRNSGQVSAPSLVPSLEVFPDVAEARRTYNMKK
jgi:hypothetical protein